MRMSFHPAWPFSPRVAPQTRTDQDAYQPVRVKTHAGPAPRAAHVTTAAHHHARSRHKSGNVGYKTRVARPSERLARVRAPRLLRVPCPLPLRAPLAPAASVSPAFRAAPRSCCERLARVPSSTSLPLRASRLLRAPRPRSECPARSRCGCCSRSRCEHSARSRCPRRASLAARSCCEPPARAAPGIAGQNGYFRNVHLGPTPWLSQPRGWVPLGVTTMGVGQTSVGAKNGVRWTSLGAETGLGTSLGPKARLGGRLWGQSGAGSCNQRPL
jgi:hypothetical protein